MIYTVTLNPSLDYVLKTNALESGKINRSAGEYITYGGKGINSSVILTRLGIANKALGFTAGFSGEKLESLLKEEGQAFEFIRLKNGETRINVKIRANEELDINARGPAVTENDVAALAALLDKAESGDYVIVSGAIPENCPDNAYAVLFEKAKSVGARLIVDTSGEQLLSALKFRPFLIKPNHHELGEAFGAEIKNAADAEKYALELQKLGAENVLVSMAENGAVLVSESGEVLREEGINGTLVNSTGCGDSMLSGFVAGLIQNGEMSYALKLANACGAATAFCEGLAEKEQIEGLLKPFE